MSDNEAVRRMVEGTVRARRRSRRGGRRQRGVALAEFALIVPLLFLLLFGIIEFGWAFGQHLDVRHGAREGARLAAVNADPGGSGPTLERRLVVEICDRMDIAAGSGTEVRLSRSGSTVGSEVTVTVEKELDQLTGFLNTFLDTVNLSSTVDIRLERTATWNATTDANDDCP